MPLVSAVVATHVGDVRSASNATGRSGDQEVGRQGQVTPEFSLRENSDVVPSAEKPEIRTLFSSSRDRRRNFFGSLSPEKFRRLRLVRPPSEPRELLISLLY